MFERDRASLQNIYASGGYGFLHDLLEVAGGDNVFGDLKQQSVQASTEMILARRPDVIIELRYGQSAKDVELSARAARLGRARLRPGGEGQTRSTFSSATNSSSRASHRRRGARAGAGASPGGSLVMVNLVI